MYPAHDGFKSSEFDSPHWGILLLITTGIVWGAVFPIVKAALLVMDPFTFTLIRYALTAVMLLIVLAVAEGARHLTCGGHKLRIWMLGTIGFGGLGVVAFYGLQYTRAEHAAVMMALLPLVTILVNWGWRGARPSALSAACIATGIIGVTFVVTHGRLAQFASEGTAGADVMVLFGVVCWAVYTLGRSTVSEWSTVRYTALTCTYSVISLALMAAIVWLLGYGRIPGAQDVQPFASEMAFTVILGSVVAVLSWNVGIGIIGPSKGVVFINLVPVTAFVIAVWQGRTPEPSEMIGVALVITALVVNSAFSPPPTTEPVPATAIRA